MPHADPVARREYHRGYMKQRYHSDPDARERQIVASNTNRTRHREWLKTLKIGLSCIRCGEDDPVCLDFHHREPDEKEFSISLASQQGWGRARVLAEIAKCDVLCANCHRKVHRS